MFKNKIVLALVIFAVIFSLITFFSANGEKPRQEPTGQALFTALPQTDLSGNPIDYHQKLILIDVWAT